MDNEELSILREAVSGPDNPELTRILRESMARNAKAHITLTLTRGTADAVAYVLREYAYSRSPVREYVEKRYRSHPIEYRNMKIGEIQDRVSRIIRVMEKIDEDWPE